MLFRSILTAAFVVTAAGILAPPPARAATITAGSSSNALSAVLAINGQGASVPNQAVATGKAPPKYSKVTSVPNYSTKQVLGLVTLSATAQDVKDTASSAGIDAKGGITAISGSSITLLSGTLTSPLGTALTLTGKTIVSGASFATTKAGATTALGSTSIGNLSIDSSVFGINLSYSGKPKPNYVAYQSKDKTVTVYLNRQITTTAGGKVTTLSVSAVNVHINKFTYLSKYVITGDINLASSNAN